MRSRDEILTRQRELRKINGNANTKRYEKTIKGFLMRTYRNMKSRITGVQKKKYHLYKDKELINKFDFYYWSITNSDFATLFENWKRNEYKQKLTPSIDRIDSSRGYILENMRWITHSENSRLGSLNRMKLWHSINNVNPTSLPIGTTHIRRI